MEKNLQQSTSPEDNSATLFGRISEWFDKNDWNYNTYGEEEEKSLSARVSCSNGKWRLVVRASEELRESYFWSTLDINVPEDRRMAVAEFITRANYGKRIGFFEMDWRDGEIRFNVSFSIADGALTDVQIAKAADGVLNGMDRHFVALMSVIYGGQDPLAALTEMNTKKAPENDMTKLEAPSTAVH
ncbi:MAG: YbjN domain-containing protein [Rugosibacter sp.]